MALNKDKNLSLEDKIEAANILEGYTFPSLATRIKALFVDVCIMLIIFVLGAKIIGYAGGAPNWVRGAILIFMLYLYEPVLVAFNGGTIGHKALNLRVKNIDDPKKNLFIISAIVRFILKSLLWWISFLTVTANKEKRAIHDLSIGSVVIVNPK